MKPIALTTPLFYVNGLPHIGSAYPTIAADALARFYRLMGHPTLFVTGTDEHGQKIQRTAEQNNLPPQEHCDRIVTEFHHLWNLLDIQFDRFIRTSDPRHTAITREFFQRVYAKGDIYLDRQQGWYCVACEEFKEERDLLADQHCPTHPNLACEWRDEANYFFRLSRYQEAIAAFHDQHPNFIQPEPRRNEVLKFIDQGLRDFSISRINLTWGIPLPIDPQHTLYVWFDALLGYLTALLDPQAEPTLTNALGHWYPFHVHIIGKDILRFHAVYWVAMLLSADLPLPSRVFGHGLLTRDGIKMGKTLGNVIDPFDLVTRYGADAVRYYFLKEIEFGKDGDFSEDRFVAILNADLANTFGNLLNRTLGMAGKYCQQRVPIPHATALDPTLQPLQTLGSSLGDRTQQHYQNLNFRAACDTILDLIRDCNKMVDETTPWKRFKAGQQEEVDAILYTLLESVRLAAYLLSPIIPNLSREIYRQLGLDFQQSTWQHHQWGTLAPNTVLLSPSPIFQRLDPPSP
jgi:methionyl-tRNA synthetase